MLRELFLTFFKIGLFTFGGGYAMIAGVRENVVEKKKWLTDEELFEVIAISESTPGPIAINMATFVGYKKKGILGSALATLGVVLPSLIIIFTISLFFEKFIQNTLVAKAFVGIKCAVAFLIAKAGLDMSKKIKGSRASVAIFAVSLSLLLLLEVISISVSAIVFILVSGILGILLFAKKEGEK